MIQSLQNPFRDWNTLPQVTGKSNAGFKASKTLLGIETATTGFLAFGTLGIQSLQNPFRDWNKVQREIARAADSKPPKPF